jgi:hypothetical protein
MGVAFFGPMYPTIPHIEGSLQFCTAPFFQAVENKTWLAWELNAFSLWNVTWGDVVPPVARVFIAHFQ